MARAREWAIRCLHEMDSFKGEGVFFTLTYADEYLPKDGSLSKRELQNFIKRIREDGHKIRYLGCGEYGEQNDRPHYHGVVFGISLDDHICVAINPDNYLKGFKCLSGPMKEAWTKGFIVLGTVTYNSVRYTMEYLHKQYNNDYIRKFYGKRERPFQLQSQGLGRDWLDKNIELVSSSLKVKVRGQDIGLPKYYLNRIVKKYPEKMLEYQRSVAEHYDSMVEGRIIDSHNKLCVEDAISAIEASEHQAAKTKLAAIDINKAQRDYSPLG